MKRVVTLLVASLLVCLVGVDQASAKKQPPTTEGIAAWFAQMDANGDKKVTKDEFVAAQVQRKGKGIKKNAAERFAQIAKGKDSFNLEEFTAWKVSQGK